MKKFLFGLLTMLALFSLVSCQDVEPGYVGVKLHQYGDKRGQVELLGVGRYGVSNDFIIIEFPIFTRQYSFTAGVSDDSPQDEAFRFQSKDGVDCSVDISIQARVDATLADKLYMEYRKDDIKDIIKSNVSKVVRDAFVEYASSMAVDEMYSSEKMVLLGKVFKKSSTKFAEKGLIIEEISYMSKIGFPDSIEKAIEAKYASTQLTLQRQQEVEKEKAQAEIAIVRARADAEVNRLQAQTITPMMIELKKIEKWDGKLPQVVGPGGSIIDLK